MSKMTPFAKQRHDALETGDKTANVREAWKKSKSTGLQKVRKAEEEEKVCKKWYGVHYVRDAYAE